VSTSPERAEMAAALSGEACAWCPGYMLVLPRSELCGSPEP
jgi:hypothetical protein